MILLYFMHSKNIFYKLINFNNYTKNCENFLLNNFIDLCISFNLNLTEFYYNNYNCKLYKNKTINFLINNKFINKFKTINKDNIYKKIYNLKTTIIFKYLIKICNILRENFSIIYDNFKNCIYSVLKKNCKNIEKSIFIEHKRTYKKDKYSSFIYINTENKKNILEKSTILNKKYNFSKNILKENYNNYIYNNNNITHFKKENLYKDFSTNIQLNNKNICVYDVIYNFYINIKQLIFGQDTIIKKISYKISNLKNNKYSKPIFSLLLCGSSGTGKTEISKMISKKVYKGEKNLIHLDMSEYMEPHSVSKLIGSPPGYVGSKKGSMLVNDITNTPNSVVLFDEIEKADTSIYSIFLQILDEGILTDSKGIKGCFDKSIVIFTSNIGSDVFKDVDTNKILNMDYESKIKQAINKHFKPEFINRLDDIIIFNPLFSYSLYLLTNKLTYKQKSINIEKYTRSLLSLMSYSPTKGSRFLLNNINKIFSNINVFEKTNFNYNKLIKCSVI